MPLAVRPLAWIVVVLHLAVAIPAAEPSSVRVRGTDGQWQLTRNGEPYWICGAGGDGSWELLAKLGGNSVRTWGHERLGEQLDEAQRLGLTVTAGIWLGQVRQGFDWSDAASLLRQRETVRQAVLKYKDHPALLMWSLGNEMEDPHGKNGAVWSEINNLARLVKSLDPNHPTMTVIAEIGGDKVRNFQAFCPDVDVLGINSYGGGPTVAERYLKLGGAKPFVLTEFGPPGIWEIAKDELGAYRELTSTAKAQAYRATYERSVAAQRGKCLGSFAFVWGQKQEVTASWFSLLLKDNARLGAADALSELWTGRPVANRCPEIRSLARDGSGLAKPGDTIKLTLSATDPERDRLAVQWTLVSDEEQYGTGGDPEASGGSFPKAVLRGDAAGAEIKLPEDGGLYRVFVTVRDDFGGAAIANVPVRVEGPVRVTAGRAATLPLTVYAESHDEPSFVPSGWMGDTKSIQLDPACPESPHTGKTSLRCEFGATSGWGAVAWQHPAEDWGNRRGGFNLTGAKRLVFFARGESGGEEVTFSFGLIGREKKYFDTAKRSLEKVKLTKEWQRFELKVDALPPGEDLTRIKTGFVWSVASPGRPVVFYLDDIVWE